MELPDPFRSPPMILDTTVRDGSYVIDFQFTSKEAAVIASGLEKAKVPLIEVGHGLGLNAGEQEGMEMPEPDDAYLEAVAGSVIESKWGTFFIPGIGRLSDIKKAASYGMDFIRIGTNVTEVEDSEQYIKTAKEEGLFVSSNFMKTYALTPEEVGERASKAASYGADIVCIVDSAGGMFPEDVETYFNAIRARTDTPIGFHGHNNLGMAIANSLKAYELGCPIIDSSIRGMGRSAGNAITEVLLFALKRKGVDTGIDTTGILNIAENIIDPLVKEYQQVNSIGVVSGYAQFHSSFLGRIFKYASAYRVDPRELIIKVSEKDKVNAPEDLIEELAEELHDQRYTASSSYPVKMPSSRKGRLGEDGLRERAEAVRKDLVRIGKRSGRTTVMNVVQSLEERSEPHVSEIVHEGTDFILGSVELSSLEEARTIQSVFDGKVDLFLLDLGTDEEGRRLSRSIKGTISSSASVLYKDVEVWGRSILQLVEEIFTEAKEVPKVALVGGNVLKEQVADKLASHSIPFEEFQSLETALHGNGYDCLITCGTEKEKAFDPSLIANGAPVIIDGRVGSFSKEEIDQLGDEGVRVYRPEVFNNVLAELSALNSLREVIQNKQGYSSLDGIPIAAGGVVAPEGTVVVDSVHFPHKVFGIADGEGYLLPDQDLSEEQKGRADHVERILASRAVERHEAPH